MSAFLQILLILVAVSISCSLLGPFLVLKKTAMMVDAISHTILLGIVLAFFLVKDLNSPLLIFGAACMGLITVYLIQWLRKTGLVDEDAAIGIVFPLLFSVAILLISLKASNVHLDVDTVLLGKVEIAPLDFLMIGGRDFGAKSIYTSLFNVLLNLLCIGILFKEWKIYSFDPDLAKAMNLPYFWLELLFILLTSVTSVISFSSVGSILVICLMVGPAASAYILSKDLRKMILFSLLYGIFAAGVGTTLAFWLDLSIAGTCAMVTGILFLLTFLWAPEEGYLAIQRRNSRQRRVFSELNVLFHLNNHKNSEEYEIEAHVETMNRHLRLEKSKYDSILASLKRKEKIEIREEVVFVTEKGEEFLQEKAQEFGIPAMK
ncbi:metal ABC transporter permease [Peptoniphilus sp. KCTC 25270]|uniref:metal ABC transporter permease n=1 Tax=Peptoniphilus sp. KCTC 25270 TaxID=2897414 RepID=UPI001E4B73F0|nr:metal ABC transporter permease [Peptoniphilus sp. KCTC 25270]MCD1146501.1 metal ABC transporter permease [Peptoniphilus sp. KCTC 25270]